MTHDQAESMALADRIIVMNNGRIEQVGGSQEIYEQPRTQFVADFVGSINLLSAKVVANRGEPGLTSVQIGELGQEWYCQTGDETAWTEGQSVLVAVRPEKLTIHGQRPDHHLNACQCRVEAAIYYGDRREYELSTGGPSLKASTSTNIVVAPGDSVFAAVDPQELVLLKREE